MGKLNLNAFLRYFQDFLLQNECRTVIPMAANLIKSKGKGERIQIQNNPRVFKLEILAPTLKSGNFSKEKSCVMRQLFKDGADKEEKSPKRTTS